MEAEGWSAVYAAAPPELALKTSEIAGATLLIAPSIDILAYNRVLSFGLNEVPHQKDLQEIIQTYASAGVGRFFLQLPPEADRDGISEMLYAQGFRPYNDWAKLRRGVADIPEFAVCADIRHATPADGPVYAEILIEAFDWTPELSGLLSCTIGKNGWSHYLALVDGEAAACAALYRTGTTAALAMAGTRPRFRGSGLQPALIRRRLLDCAGAGVQTVVTETGVDGPDHPSPSFRNMRKAGFELAYLRRNWLFEG